MREGVSMIKMVSRVNGIGGQLGRRENSMDYYERVPAKALPEVVEG